MSKSFSFGAIVELTSVRRNSRLQPSEDIQEGSNGQKKDVSKVVREPDDKECCNHLVVLVHGVSGEPECFNVLLQTLGNQLEGAGVVMAVSKVNRKEGSHDGVVSCGLKLAEEVKQLITMNPTVEKISFVAYSIGGLFVRYACGANFDPNSRKIFGLEACNFLSIATPHLGCDVQGASQVTWNLLDYNGLPIGLVIHGCSISKMHPAQA